MELQVRVVQKAGIINSNFDEIKQQVESAVAIYKGVIVTEDTVKNSKKDIAELRKAKKEIDDKRKEIKRTFLEPFEEFEKECKQIMAIIDDPINLMESQTKEFEAKKKQEKRVENMKIFEAMTEGYEEYLPVEKYYKDSWDNVTTSSKAVKEEISQLIDVVVIGISTIKALDSDYEDKGLKEFKTTLNVAVAIQMIKALEKQRDEIIERERIKKEREEQERIRRDEEVKRQEEEKAAQAKRDEEEARRQEENDGFLNKYSVGGEEEAFLPEEEEFLPEDEKEAAFELIRVFNFTFKLKEISVLQAEMVEKYLQEIFIDYEVEEE